MQQLLKNKLVGWGLVVLVVLGLVYYVITSSNSSSPLSVSNEGTSPVSQQILSTLGELRTIRLDPSLFTDPVFVSLSDYSTIIPPQQAGRRNPFAPLGAATQAPPASQPQSQ